MGTRTPPNPPPGSDAAIGAGCRCPVLDNAHGRGAFVENGVPQFWRDPHCPLHGNELVDRLIEEGR